MPEIIHKHIGGSFSPPLSEEILTKYKDMIGNLPSSPVKDALVSCLNCCLQWWNLPDSVERGQRHWTGATMFPLTDANKKSLDEHIPWEHEIESMKVLFGGISNETHKELRDAAHHLLWHVAELSGDREPLTNDQLPKD